MWIGDVLSGVTSKDECKIINTFGRYKYLEKYFYKSRKNTYLQYDFLNFCALFSIGNVSKYKIYFEHFRGKTVVSSKSGNL